MLYKMLNNKHGFTLVELLVTLTILVLVLGIGYTFYIHDFNTFSSGTKQSKTQQDIRLAANTITNELRYLTNLTISNTNPNSFDDNSYYIYINDNPSDSNNGYIMLKKPGSQSSPIVLNDSIKFVLTFKKEADKILSFEIHDTNGTYSVGSKVTLMNLIGAIPGNIGDSGVTICYLNNAPVIKKVDLNPNYSSQGHATNIGITVTTLNVDDGTPVTAEFVDSEKNTLSPKITNTITNNSSTFTLDIGATLLNAGFYTIKVTVNGISVPYSEPYKIFSLVIDDDDTHLPPMGTVGRDYLIDNNFKFSVNGGMQPYIFSVSSGLPPGLNINPSTGVITGTPLPVPNLSPSPYPYTFTLTVTDSSVPTKQIVTWPNCTINIAQLLAFSPTLPFGILDQPYGNQIVGGGKAPYTFTINSGTLPPGLGFQSYSNGIGTIIGTPSTEGVYPFSVTVTDDETSPQIIGPKNFTIEVKKYVTNITISATNTTIDKDTTLPISAEVSPSDATDNTITWSVTGVDGAIISQGSQGILDPRSNVGTAIVKATANDGSGVVSNTLIITIT